MDASLSVSKSKKKTSAYDKSEHLYTQNVTPDQIPGFKNLPMTVQGLMRSLGKTKKMKTEYDIKKLLSYAKDVEFF